MLPEPPFPIAASFNPGGPTAVTFSTWLNPGLINRANWDCRFNNLRATALKVEVVPDYRNPIVHITWGLFGPNPGPDVVNYAPPPFDVRSRIGDIPAPAFAGFPLDP